MAEQCTKKSGRAGRVPSINPDSVTVLRRRMQETKDRLLRAQNLADELLRKHEGPGELTIEGWRRDLGGARAELEALDRKLEDYLARVGGPGHG